MKTILADVEAIVSGRHGDPFRVLGLHEAEKGLVVRVFLPQASEVVVVVGGKKYGMVRVHPAGFFERTFPRRKNRFAYQLQFTNQQNETHLIHDPYAFSSSLKFSQLIYQALGAQVMELGGVTGVRFAVWAPNAQRVSVIGDFNEWDERRHPMRFHHEQGLWELFIPGLAQSALYKYDIVRGDYTVEKADPVAFYAELRPDTASVVWDIEQYRWGDEAWMADRSADGKPMSIYEVHLGSWRRREDDSWLTYAELAEQLIPYVQEMGFTHIELMPVAEHPYDGSWGYQVTGYYAATSRFGTPDEFMAFVDACHQAGIGVILDWVPAHFPRDGHGLSYFDGTHFYEHADPRQGAHPDWGTLIFNYGRDEVRRFLIDNALFWLDKYHIDGLRVDAVASMLYLDFSRESGEWLPNRFGGRENLEAIGFIRMLNRAVHTAFPTALMIAEESTAWPSVTGNVANDGLGFDIKWNMGWMHDTLRYMSNDPIHRAFHHGTLTFSLMYAFSERFLLPFSHDEVVHLKKSMLDKMVGDVWRKFANLRALYAYMFSHPGKKLLFMGCEFGQWREWSEKRALDWDLLEGEEEKHQALQRLVRDLNGFYCGNSAMYGLDYDPAGFTWLDFRDIERSVIAYARHSPGREQTITVICNFTPVVRENYKVPVLEAGTYKEVLNTDSEIYGGSDVANDEVEAVATPAGEHGYEIRLTLPPLAVIYLKKIEN